MKVLITGAAGFLGSHVVRSFLDRGHNVFASIRSESNIWRLNEIVDSISVEVLDILDEEAVNSTIHWSSPDMVINCAAYGVNYSEQEVDKSISVNISGSLNLLESIAKNFVEYFIHIGSCFEYGSYENKINEDDPLLPTSVYGSTKAAASIILKQRAHELGINLLILRPFGIWGPLEANFRLVPEVIMACLNKKRLKLTGCKQVRDYTFVTDMSDAIAETTLLRPFPEGEIVNVCSGIPVILKDFVMNIAKELGGENLMQFDALEYRSTEMWHLVGDNKKWKALNLPIVSKTALNDGVAAAIDEIKKRVPNYEKVH